MNNDIVLDALQHRPAPYEAGTLEFWDDDYISKGMLAAHLDPETEAATRKPEFVRRSAEWIAGLACTGGRPKLLDLGCGPGIYAQLFDEAGFDVTGFDLSRRSIDYARVEAARKNSRIEYICGNYLDIGFDNVFDAVTLIYCDFGVLCPGDRAALLRKIHRALKPGGLFIVDVCSLRQYEDRPESTSWSYANGGFWSERPYACLYAFLRYDDTRTFADRYVIVEKDRLRCFNVWNHRFTKEELKTALKEAGFESADFYRDVAGGRYSPGDDTICAVARRKIL